jgi:hypothetical protein
MGFSAVRDGDRQNQGEVSFWDDLSFLLYVQKKHLRDPQKYDTFHYSFLLWAIPFIHSA